MKKRLAIAGAIGAGAALGAYLFTQSKYYNDTARFWLLCKPDFSALMDSISGVLSRSRFWQHFDLSDFEPRDEYCGDLYLRWKKDDMGTNLIVLDELMDALVEATDLPCWCSKEIYAKDDSNKLVGVALAIGHSCNEGAEPEEVTEN